MAKRRRASGRSSERAGPTDRCALILRFNRINFYEREECCDPGGSVQSVSARRSFIAARVHSSRMAWSAADRLAFAEIGRSIHISTQLFDRIWRRRPCCQHPNPTHVRVISAVGPSTPTRRCPVGGDTPATSPTPRRRPPRRARDAGTAPRSGRPASPAPAALPPS